MPIVPDGAQAKPIAARPARWDAAPQVLSPVGRSAEELLAVRPRRQALDGFEPVYSDIVDYIVRCTHRIWEEKDVGLCRTHYAETCRMHTLTGWTEGVEQVVQATKATLAAYSDRVVIAEDVVWSEDAPGLFHSSHRITSYGTHLGDDAAWPASLLAAGVSTIADCAVRENLIVEEWLTRDNLDAVRQLGLDPWTVAREMAEADRAGDPARHAWRQMEIDEVRQGSPAWPEPDHPAAVLAEALRLAGQDLYGEAARLLAPAVEVRWPSGRHGYGRGYWIGCQLQLRGGIMRPDFRLDHWAARPLPGGDVAVALRWRLAGIHQTAGVWGPASGRTLLVMAITHARLRAGRIVEEITVFDELAVLRQIAGGLGA